jgi:hypothetical protein
MLGTLPVDGVISGNANPPIPPAGALVVGAVTDGVVDGATVGAVVF